MAQKQVQCFVVESDALIFIRRLFFPLPSGGKNGLADSIGEKICRFVEENTDAELTDIQIERR